MKRGPAALPDPRAGKVRIIGGRWRGTRLEVPGIDGLRPSSDRVRETLFNWLQGQIVGARCLDLFAGSGALGFEAASRGAREVVMIERDVRAAAGLRLAAQRLQATQIEVVEGDALAWLQRGSEREFDLVFVDPPFATSLHQTALDRLAPWLADEAQVYLEYGPAQAPPVLPGFTPRRDGRTRDARFSLLHRSKGLPVTDAPVTLEPTSGAGPASRT